MKLNSRCEVKVGASCLPGTQQTTCTNYKPCSQSTQRNPPPRSSVSFMDTEGDLCMMLVM
ncbi:hypothetical protein RchiOBHm_Chr4g0418201 [Rosa chinensis]|uniref:Uncharacterized protein n=1 Tax=Rosa chinensis TaxID=74649 RepID=A0A2P6QXI3_ROSCH|nr:hypothetical protein RchiOBHm_Chr4g0418201 [Rosa chinensis]